jgi:hypothetical protein
VGSPLIDAEIRFILTQPSRNQKNKPPRSG